MKKLVFVCLAVTFAVSCATYQNKVMRARDLLRKNQASTSVQELEPLAMTEGRDQLVYLLDYATALQQNKQFKESSQAFIKADELSDIKDYHSITKNAASLLLSEELVQYKGDDYEKLMINAMNAINFLMMDELDSALVEVRRLNNKLKLYRTEAKRDWEPSTFGLYLSAIIWEADKKWDDAYIDYKKTYELDPSIEYLKMDLVRASAKSQRWADHKRWLKKFNMKPGRKPEWNHRQYGELVFILKQGWGPRKYPSSVTPRLPELNRVYSSTHSVRLFLDREGKEELEEDSQVIYNIEAVAMKTLKDQYAPLVAKRVAGVVVKEVIADQVRQENELLGNLLALGFRMSDRADLRQWSTLPRTFQVARLTLKPGTYKVRAQGLNQSGDLTGERMPEKEFTIKAGKKTFMNWRTFY